MLYFDGHTTINNKLIFFFLWVHFSLNAQWINCLLYLLITFFFCKHGSLQFRNLKMHNLKSDITQYSNSYDSEGLLIILMHSCYSAEAPKYTYGTSFFVPFPLQMCSPCTRSSTCGTLCFWETRLSLSASV